MPKLKQLVDDSIIDLVQFNLLDKLLTSVFVEGVLPFYLRPILELESDEFEAEVYKTIFAIGLVVEALEPAL